MLGRARCVALLVLAAAWSGCGGRALAPVGGGLLGAGPVDFGAPPDLALPLDLAASDLAASARGCAHVGADPGEADPVARAAWARVGAWRGTVTTPWTAPYQVELTFAADGSYVGRTVAHPGVTFDVAPFYFDSDPDQGSWRVIASTPTGAVGGSLTLAPFPNAVEDLTNLTVDDTATQLAFDFYHLHEYGPLHYQLRCTP
jgi:hypothetical protein